MKRKWIETLGAIASVCVAITMIVLVRPGLFGLATATTTHRTCPDFTHPGYTYSVDYNTTTGFIMSVGAASSNLTPPFQPGVATIYINASLNQEMQCTVWENSNTPNYVWPWHVDLATQQVVKS